MVMPEFIKVYLITNKSETFAKEFDNWKIWIIRQLQVANCMMLYINGLKTLVTILSSVCS